MGVGAGLYMCDVVVKSSRSLSHLLMSSCYFLGCACETTESYITMTAINTVVHVISVEHKGRQRLFRARDKFQQQRSSRQQFLRTVGYSYAAVSDL